jgi:hypothetical protein
MWDTLYMANVNNNNTSGRYNQTTCHNIRWSWPNSFYSCFFQFPDLVQQQGMRRRVRTRWGQAYVDECSRTRNFFGTCSCCSHPLGASPRSLCNSFVSPLPSYRLGAHTHSTEPHLFSRETFSPLSLSFIFPIALHLCHPRPLHAWEELVELGRRMLFVRIVGEMTPRAGFTPESNLNGWRLVTSPDRCSWRSIPLGAVPSQWKWVCIWRHLDTCSSGRPCYTNLKNLFRLVSLLDVLTIWPEGKVNVPAF